MSGRIDIWDVEASKQKQKDIDCGYSRDFDDRFTWGKVLGKGGFGLVRVVADKHTGEEFACKSVPKRLDVPGLAAERMAQHILNTKREISILRKLRGTLSVVHFEGAFEDEEYIHIVMEWCRGGELDHTIGQRLYTEAMVAGYMRAVLHTLAQCHAHRILHRDVKPGNFMLLNESEESPLKAIDFGLAVFFDPAELPRTDLGLEGTPWFMAPEALSSEVWPASDIWAAGVMAYQLLSGYLPFDDRRNPNSPALSLVWRAILTEEPSFKRSCWESMSDEAKDFVKTLLNKDHKERPNAREALAHPWLAPAFHAGKRRPISQTVVQRIQRYAQTNLLRRTILELIAAELIKMAPPQLSPSASMHGGSAFFQAQHAAAETGTTPPELQPLGDGRSLSPGSSAALCRAAPARGLSAEEGPESPTSLPLEPSPFQDSPGHGGLGQSKMHTLLRVGGSAHGGGAFVRSPSAQQLQLLATAASRRGGVSSVHSGQQYWRLLRQAGELASMASGHGRQDYLHLVPRSDEERTTQRKAARLSLDTSVHRGEDWKRLVAAVGETGGQGGGEGGASRWHKPSGGGMRASKSTSSLLTQMLAGGRERPPAVPAPPPPAVLAVPPPEQPAAAVPAEVEEGRGRGRSSALQMLARASAEAGMPGRSAQQPAETSPWASAPAAGAIAPPPPPPAAPLAAPPAVPPAVAAARHVSFDAESPQAPAQRVLTNWPDAGGAAPMVLDQPGGRPVAGGVPLARVPGAVTTPRDLERLMRRMHFHGAEGGLTAEALREALYRLGYELTDSEVAALLREVDDADGKLAQPAFVASQLDWHVLASNNRRACLGSQPAWPASLAGACWQCPPQGRKQNKNNDHTCGTHTHTRARARALSLSLARARSPCRDLWLECARRAFEGLDAAGGGRLPATSLVTVLRGRLPVAEVDAAVEDALVEAGLADAESVDFEGFLRVLAPSNSCGSLDSLDAYDPRLRASAELLDLSVHGAPNGELHSRLQSVPEDEGRA